jgi:hypothetical protein
MFKITFFKRLLTDAREVSVLQLQFLDLMIRKEDVAVPIDAKAQTELIGLMARMIVVVFQGGRVNDGDSVQSQDQAGTPGPQSHRLLTAIQREASTAEQGKPAASV